MQDVEKCSKRDGQHMSALMESAKGMLKNGATPDVVIFAEETLADIAAVVSPDIVDEQNPTRGSPREVDADEAAD